MLSLKRYQEDAVRRVDAYGKVARQMQDPDTAFYRLTRTAYRPAPHPDLSATPYVCVKIPTGGGKTLVAAHSLEEVFNGFLRLDTGLVIWFVPWDSILTQTLAALREGSHPYRQVLDAAFPKGVKVE